MAASGNLVYRYEAKTAQVCDGTFTGSATASRPFHCPATVHCATRCEGHASGVGVKAHQQSWTLVGAVQCTAVTVIQVVPPLPGRCAHFETAAGAGLIGSKERRVLQKKVDGPMAETPILFPTRFDELESVGGG